MPRSTVTATIADWPSRLASLIGPRFGLGGIGGVEEHHRIGSLHSEARIEQVPEPVADDVDGDHRRHDSETGEDRHPGGVTQELAPRAEHRTPFGRRGTHTETEEAQRRPG